ASFDKIVAIAAHSIYFEVLGDHGFIGLVLYLLMLWSTWRCAGTTRRLVRREPQLRWVGDLTSMIQVSLVSFLVAGAALSMAYYDMVYLLLGVAVSLRNIVMQSIGEAQVNTPTANALVSAP